MLPAPDADAARYLKYHRRRYAFLLETVHRVLQQHDVSAGRPARVLDVGMAHQTRLIRELFPNIELATLGYFDYRFPRMENVVHTDFDLNAAADQAHWPDLEPFDLILMAEVIEHLYVPPTRVLRMMRALLRPGGTFVIQTPNPVNLARRLSLLAGNSPFEIIRDDIKNPGHYCEYTVEDLLFLARESGLEVLEYSVMNYFGDRKPLYNFVCSLLPGRMEEGITMLMSRPHS